MMVQPGNAGEAMQQGRGLQTAQGRHYSFANPVMKGKH